MHKMFSFLSKGSGPDITDMVWMSEEAMQAGVGRWLAEHANGIVACWFRDDLVVLQQAVPAEFSERFVLCSSLTADAVKGRQVLVAGHYPLPSAEAAFAEQVGLKKLLVYAALTSPLFRRFGGAKIIEVARSMGMKEDEGIEHFLVSSAIKKAQGKIANQVSNDLAANSEQEWMLLNLPETME